MRGAKGEVRGQKEEVRKTRLELVCPDCGRASGWRAVRTEVRALAGQAFIECPVCKVGSRPDAWEVAA